MNTVAEIRDELAEIASALRAQKGSAEASRLESLNKTFFTTTTEYLVEALDLMDQLRASSAFQHDSIRPRVDAVRAAARRLANLR